MYNRYIPRPDGSYSCSRVPEPKRSRPDNKPPSPPPRIQQENPQKSPPIERKPANRQEHNSPGFLRQLFGKDFDTGDLLIILLLLLMAGDSEEDRSNALLTIALYFMM